jgi:23S rRNA (guanosine2251-2'-O)-methyltransferase
MRKLTTDELNRLSVEQFKEAEKIPLILILDNIRSRNNVGSIFRSADAFRISGVYLCGITAVPPHREIYKTALGATDSVDWKYFSSTLDAVKSLKKSGFKVFAVEQTDNSVSLENFIPELQTGIGLVFGNEVTGIDDNIIEETDGCIEVPQYGTKHSLNIAVTAGIVLWDFLLKSGNSYKKMQPF